MTFTTRIKKLYRKIRNVFVPEVMVGPTTRPPVNRKERRAVAAITRKQTNKGKKS